MRERFVDIEFDEEGKGPTFAGSIVRLNESVNVLRIRVRCLDDPSASLQISMKRADGKKGTDSCERFPDYFQYRLPGWATAVEGDLKVSFSLVYSDAYEQLIDDGTVVDVFPVDYQRMITLKVEPSVGNSEEINNTPDITNSLLERISLLEDGVLKVGEIDAGAWEGGS